MLRVLVAAVLLVSAVAAGIVAAGPARLGAESSLSCAVATPPAAPAVTISGEPGERLLGPLAIPDGTYRVAATLRPVGNDSYTILYVTLHDRSGEAHYLVTAGVDWSVPSPWREAGEWSSETVVTLDASSEVIAAVEADGWWRVTLTPLWPEP